MSNHPTSDLLNTPRALENYAIQFPRLLTALYRKVGLKDDQFAAMAGWMNMQGTEAQNRATIQHILQAASAHHMGHVVPALRMGRTPPPIASPSLTDKQYGGPEVAEPEGTEGSCNCDYCRERRSP